MKPRIERLSMSLCVFVFVGAGLVLTERTAGANLTAEQVRAVVGIREVVVGPLLDQPHPYGLRIHLYSDELGSNTSVMPYVDREGIQEPLWCHGRCLLFFVDRDPFAHWAHPVVIALWDLESDSTDPVDRIQWMHAEWWPVVKAPGWEGFPPEGKPTFNTVASRASDSNRERMTEGVTVDDLRMGTIVYDLLPREEIFDPAVLGRLTQERPTGVGRSEPTHGAVPTPRPHPSPQPSPTPQASTSPSCGVWAVIVNGSLDITDTFDEDTDGMYAVLKGHQVPEDHIYYLSPHHPAGSTPPTVGEHLQLTTKANVRNALEQLVPTSIQNSGSVCDEFLLFYSAHGGGAVTSYVEGGSGAISNMITVPELNNWLGAVPCERVTVVIEACHSGGFLPALNSSPNSANPQKRFVFTSTSAAGTSHADVDSIGDPNPGDAGSETIWGYIEAFGMSAADSVLAERKISFGEAVKYAMENDITYLNGSNQPKSHPLHPWTPQTQQRAAHWCYQETGLPDLDVPTPPAAEATSTATAAALFGPSFVTVSNTGTAALPVASIRLFEPKPWQWQRIRNASGGPMGSLATQANLLAKLRWPGDFQQVGNTRLLSGLDGGATRSYRMNRFSTRSSADSPPPRLLVVVDSPRDPMTSGSLEIKALLMNDNNVGTTTLQ